MGTTERKRATLDMLLWLLPEPKPEPNALALLACWGVASAQLKLALLTTVPSLLLRAEDAETLHDILEVVGVPPVMIEEAWRVGTPVTVPTELRVACARAHEIWERLPLISQVKVRAMWSRCPGRPSYRITRRGADALFKDLLKPPTKWLEAKAGNWDDLTKIMGPDAVDRVRAIADEK